MASTTTPAQQLVVALGARTGTVVHRATCKRITGERQTGTPTAEQLTTAKRCTACKPGAQLVQDAAAELLAQLKQGRELAVPGSPTVERALAAALGRTQPVAPAKRSQAGHPRPTKAEREALAADLNTGVAERAAAQLAATEQAAAELPAVAAGTTGADYTKGQDLGNGWTAAWVRTSYLLAKRTGQGRAQWAMVWLPTGAVTTAQSGAHAEALGRDARRK